MEFRMGEITIYIEGASSLLAHQRSYNGVCVKTATEMHFLMQ